MLWDARMHELFGVAPGSFSGAYDDFLSLVHFEDRPRLAMEMAAAFGKRTNFAVKFRVICPSFSAIRPLEMGFKVHSDTEGRPQRFSGVCWEVAEQRWPETALVPERYLLATMMDNLTDLIYFKDRESRFTAVNRLFLCRAGLKEQSEIIGKTDKDLYAEEHASAALADERKIIATANQSWVLRKRRLGPMGAKPGFPPVKYPSVMRAAT